MQHDSISSDRRVASDGDALDDGRVGQVIGAVDDLRRAEARLVRRRQSGDGLSDVDRTAVRFVVARATQVEQATPKDLAVLLGISTASTTTLLDRLIRGGLIETRPHPVDRRKKLLMPTRGTQNPDDDSTLTSAIREIGADLSDTEAQLLVGALRRVTHAVDDEQAR